MSKNKSHYFDPEGTRFDSLKIVQRHQKGFSEFTKIAMQSHRSLLPQLGQKRAVSGAVSLDL